MNGGVVEVHIKYAAKHGNVDGNLIFLQRGPMVAHKKV